MPKKTKKKRRVRKKRVQKKIEPSEASERKESSKKSNMGISDPIFIADTYSPKHFPIKKLSPKPSTKRIKNPLDRLKLFPEEVVSKMELIYMTPQNQKHKKIYFR
jgi:hypothetical protein